MNQNIMIENLGMFWQGFFEFKLPSAGSAKNAVHIFKQNIAPITYHYVTTLEHNPTTLPQTQTILEGQSVSGLAIDDMMQVKRYGDGAKMLMSMISDGTFTLSEKTACALHNYVGKEEALTWGKFRDSLVAICNVNQYTPPDSRFLSAIAAKGFSFLDREIKSPHERAVATFLFMSRTQFFHDANKRTASLMMNGVLMSEGIFPTTIINRNSEEFHTKLTDFYNTGNASEMMHFFEKSMKEVYPPQEQGKIEPQEAKAIIEIKQRQGSSLGL